MSDESNETTTNDEFVLPDLSGLEKQEFNAIPTGIYVVRLIEMPLSKASTGNWMYNLKLRVLGPQYAGRYVFDKVVMTQKALWKFQQVLEAFDLEEFADKDLSDIKPSELTEELLGRICTVSVDSSRVYEGKVQTDVKKYSKISSEELAKYEAEGSPLAPSSGSSVI